MTEWSGDSTYQKSDSPPARFEKRAFRVRAFRRASRLVFAATVAVAMLVSGYPASTAQTNDSLDAIERAVTWLNSQRAGDGGFVGPSGDSDPGVTIDAIIAQAAAASLGIDSDFGATLNYLTEEALVVAQVGPAQAAKLALALMAVGENPRDFANVNPLAIVEVAAAGGQIGFGPYEHALGLLALAGAGEPVPDPALTYLDDTVSADGAWAFDGSNDAGAADTNTTALVVQALVSAGVAEAEFAGAVDYLTSAQLDEGGYPYQPGGEADSNSTALVIQALLAAGLERDDPAVAPGLDALLAFQNENGSFSWMLDPRDDNILSTTQAVPAIAGLALPIIARGEPPPSATASPVASPSARSMADREAA